MRSWITLTAAGLVAVAILGALLLMDETQEQLRPRPAALYLIQSRDLGERLTARVESSGHFDRTMLRLPDFYPERERIPGEVHRWMGTAPGKGDNGRKLLEGWDWLETSGALIAAGEQGGQSVRTAASLFGGAGGARRAFRAAMDAARAEGLAPGPGPLELPVSEAAWLEGPAEKDGERRYVVLLRNTNLVQRLEVLGGDGDGRERTAELARLAVAKSAGEVTLAFPTPGRGPTPAAQPPWLGPDRRRPPRDVLHERVGPSHCGWDDTVFLTWRGVEYVRDFEGELVDKTPGRFEATSAGTLPAGARDTRFRSGERELWAAEGERPDFVYVRTSRGTERWPRFDGRCD